jgi:hypothetical protein
MDTRLLLIPLTHSLTSPLLVFTRTCACPSPFLNSSRDPQLPFVYPIRDERGREGLKSPFTPVYVSLELDFHESKLKVIGVDDIVGDAGEAGIRSARLQRSLSHA